MALVVKTTSRNPVDRPWVDGSLPWLAAALAAILGAIAMLVEGLRSSRYDRHDWKILSDFTAAAACL